MFDRLKETLRDALSRASSPQGRAALAQMRDALVQAKVGLADLREGVERTRSRLVGERNELETVRRRGKLAAGIDDRETVRIAEQYDRKHVDRVVVLEKKLAAQEEELALAEHEIAEMTAQLRAAHVGVPPDVPSAPVPDPLEEAKGEPDALRRDIERAARDAHAQQQLNELKRRMGK
ncbi:MAG: hypothetical protein ACT4PJ_07025 [Gemmatimonadaceae bacterium]